MNFRRLSSAALVCAVAFGASASTTPAGTRTPLRIREAALASHARPTALAVDAALAPRDPVTADPPLRRPTTKPCSEVLFSHVRFADFTPKTFTFTPTACRGPWSKVVFDLDLTVTKGRQFDRTVEVGLRGTNIYFGTTAEPSRNVSPHWNTERDLTDYSSLFTKTQTGQISIGNVVNSTYTGILIGRGQLDFYPADAHNPAPTVPDLVVPLADQNGNAVSLATTASQDAISFVPPTNVERAYLDVFAQSQGGDEFWYTCFPNDLAAKLNNCGNTAFRETEASVDGKPAGVAPVFPWIYTGGIDPYLWRPIPGVQTLNFKPFRLDLTPFAGTLDDGASHQVSLSVFNADNGFSVIGNLFLFLDKHARGRLHGALDSDTLAATPVETVTERGSYDAANHGSGTIDTSSSRAYSIAGHVDTSHGRVDSRVSASASFAQHQAVTNGAAIFTQTIDQQTKIAQSSFLDGKLVDPTGDALHFYTWPLKLAYTYAVRPDGTSYQKTEVNQAYDESDLQPFLSSAFSSIVEPKDTLEIDATGTITGFVDNASSHVYKFRDSTGICFGRRVASAAAVLTSIASTDCNVAP